MGKTAVVTARLDADTLNDLDRLATLHDRPRAWIAAHAIKTFVDEEKAFLASLDDAEAAIDRGEYYTQAEMEAWLEAKIAARSKHL